jgi:hypothetical protein
MDWTLAAVRPPGGHRAALNGEHEPAAMVDRRGDFHLLRIMQALRFVGSDLARMERQRRYGRRRPGGTHAPPSQDLCGASGRTG